MRKQMTKMIIALLLVLCMAVPSNLPAFAANDSTVTELDGAISQLCSDITEYRQESGFTYPNAPAEYTDYVFAGWYTDEECKSALSEKVAGAKITEENKTAYAKFVPKGVLSVKAQVLSGTEFGSTNSKIRFVTTVDSLRYQKVGFDFDIRGIKLNSETTTVYHRIQAMGSNGTVLKHYTPDVFDSESLYFMACVVEGIKNSQFGLGIKATPYWVTLDGTKVTGESNMKSVNMSYMPMTETVSTEQKGEIAFPSSDAWGENYNNTYVSGQGGCFDGTYYYQAIIHSADKSLAENQVSFDGSDLEYNQNLNRVIIQKFSHDDAGTWSFSKQSEVLELRHANDITYNSKLSYTDADGVTKKGLLVISYCGNYNESKYYIGFMDRDNLSLVNPAEIDGIQWDSIYCSVNETEKYVKVSKQITNIAYNETRNQYVAGISGSHHIQVFDANFKPIKTISVFDSEKAKSYTAQGIETDDGYIYFLYSAGNASDYQKNMIAVYDWDGNFVNMIETDIDAALEIENIGIYKNEIYIAVCDSANMTKTLMYKVTGLQNFVSDVSKGTDVFELNKTAVTDVYVETTLKTTEASTSAYPRVGLRLTNEAGTNVDFVVAYSKNATPTFDSMFVIQTNANGDVSGSKQLYTITSALDTLTTDGIKLAMAKRGDTIYLYINDVLQATKKYGDFGATDKVTAQLYSKVTKSEFSNYSATTENLDVAMAELEETFAGDADKSTIYFDLLDVADASEPKVVTNETGTWKGSSIVNWHGKSRTNFYAETNVEMNTSHATGSSAGMVITSGENRFFVLLTGTESGLTELCCYSMTGDLMDNKSTTYPTGKVKEYTTSISLTGKQKLALERNGNTLKILLNDELKTTIDLSTVEYTITGAAMVGLTAWKAKATFTNYEFALKSVVTTGTDLVASGKEAATDVYVETMMKTTETSSTSYPRVGLRLTNEAGTNVDFVVAFKKNATPTFDSILVTQTNANGDVSGTQQKYTITSGLDILTTEGIKLGMAKKGDTIYLYVNDILYATKKYDDFGATDKVTPHLYSKVTTTRFMDYSIYTSNIATGMLELNETFEADENKSTIYFDLLGVTDATEPKVVTNETGTWKDSSIVNWHDVSAKKFYAETSVKIAGSNATGSAAGIVLTEGDDRFFVMLNGTSDGITAVNVYSMTGDVMDNYHATNYPTGKVCEYTATVSLENEVKLAVLRDGNNLLILINDEIQAAIDLSEVMYPITGASKVGLTGWKVQAEYTGYNIIKDEESPTIKVYNPTVIQENIDASDFAWNATYDVEANEVSVGVESTGNNAIQTMALSEKATKDIYVETTISIPEVNTGKWARTGLRLTTVTDEGKTKNLDFVLGYQKNTTKMFGTTVIVQRDASDAEKLTEKSFASPLTPGSTDSAKLAIAKSGDTLYFYFNGELIDSRVDTYGFFDADATVIASLLSQYTISSYSDYKVLEGYESDASKGTDIMALNTSAVTDVYAETIINIDSFGNVNWPRVGLRFTSTADKTADFYIAYNNSARLNPQYTGAEYALNGTSKGGFANDDEATVVKPDGIKLGVAKIGSKFYVYINDVSYGSVTVDGFDATTGVTVSLYSKNTESMFTGFGLPEMDKTIALATNTFAESGATKSVVLSDTGVPKMEVQLSGATSGAHKYLYFKEKSTKVYAETNVNFTATSTGDQRIGIALSDVNKSTQLGIYLYAKGISGVTKLQIYALSGFANGWGSSPASVDLTKITGLENIGRENIKLSVEREGDSYMVYVNNIKAYEGKISAISNFNMDATTETHIGLIAMQTGASFSDFTYSYGDAVNAN